MANTQTFQGSWNQLLGEIKHRWGNLTDDDLRIGEGQLDKLIGKIQQRTGESRQEIERYVHQMASSGASMMSSAAQTVGQYANTAREQLGDRFGQLSEQASEGYERASRMIRQNPSQSVAVVFGVGLVLGIIAGMSMKSSSRY